MKSTWDPIPLLLMGANLPLQPGFARCWHKLPSITIPILLFKSLAASLSLSEGVVSLTDMRCSCDVSKANDDPLNGAGLRPLWSSSELSLIGAQHLLEEAFFI